MKARRTHLKSRTGCATCRQRRIKCDESKPQCINCLRRQVRCDFLSQPSASQSSAETPQTQVVQILRANTDGENEIFEEPQSLQLLFPLNESPDLSKQERFLMAHSCKISDEVVAAGVESLDLGLSLLPEFDAPYSSQLLVRSTHSMVYLAYHYRDLALRGLRESLTVLNQGNMDAMLAASCLLSWQAPESQEYMQTMKGVDLALNEMEKFGHQSELRTLLQPSANQETVSFRNVLCPIDTSVELACSSLKDLQKQVGDDCELIRGIKELINFMQNLRISPPGSTPEEQLQALHPIRHWLSWLPKALLRVSERDPLIMLFIAHYNMVSLAVEPILPASRNPFALAKKVDSIERIDQLLDETRANDQQPESPKTHMRRRRESLHTLMFGPLTFARQWRQVNFVPMESTQGRRATAP